MFSGTLTVLGFRCTIFIAALGASVACLAQDTRPIYTVRGVVEDRITHQPIARALVDSSEDAVLTDGEGRFELHLHQGFSQLQVRRPGYEGDMRRQTPRSVDVGPNMPDLTLYLTPSASISGRVTLAGDDDPDDIRLISYRKMIVEGREQWINAGAPAQVDSDGNFRLTELETPGSFVICNQPSLQTIPNPRDGRGSGYASLCFPGGTDFASATPVTLSPGQQAQVEISLSRQTLYTVTFTLANRTREQGPYLQIFDRGGRALPFVAGFNAEKGTAEIQLPSGSYYAEARTRRDKLQEYGRVDFTVADMPLRLNMVMLPLHPVPVQIHKEMVASSGDGSHNAVSVYFSPGGRNDASNPGLNLTLIPADSIVGDMRGGVRHVEGGGPEDFEMEAQPGRYRVNAQAFQGYISSITSGGVDLTREPLTIGPGNSSSPIEITVRNDGGIIACTLNSGRDAMPAPGSPMQQSIAYALPLFPTTTRIFQAVMSGPNKLYFGNLPPGQYRVIAFDSYQQIDLDDPQEMARLNGQGQTVTVQAGTTTNVALDVVKTDGEDEGQ